MVGTSCFLRRSEFAVPLAVVSVWGPSASALAAAQVGGDGVEIVAAPEVRAGPCLEKLLAAREFLATGELTWSARKYDADRAMYPNETRFYSAKFSPAEVVRVTHGNAAGEVSRSESGNVVTTRLQGTLWAEGQHWWHELDPILPATVKSAQGSMPYDPRTFGLSASPGCPPASRLRENLGSQKCTEASDGPFTTLRFISEDGQATQFWLDPERGGAPVRVRTEWANGRRFEARYKLAERDGVWFPTEAVFYDSEFENGASPTQEMMIIGATFNRPEHPLTLGPEEIGVVSGGALHLRQPDGSIRPGVWGGDRIMTDEEYSAAVRAGLAADDPRLALSARMNNLRQGERLQRLLERSGERVDEFGRIVKIDPSSDKPRTSMPESEWERYVRAFCEKYRLDEDQRQKAEAILEECKQLAHQRADPLARKIDELNAPDAPPAEDAAAVQKRREQTGQLRERIEKITTEVFHTDLVPRIEKLPTRAQRRAVDGPASRPAGDE